MLEGLPHALPLRFLTGEQVARLHEASLDILERTGLQVEHARLAGLLADHGAKWECASQRVRFPRELVLWGLRTAPRSFHLHTRNLDRALPVSATSRIAHNSGGPAVIRDLDTGERRPACRQDVIDGAVVVDALENIDSYTPLVSPRDVLPAAVEVEAFDAALRHTVKPLVSAVLSDREVRFLQRAYGVIAGDERRLRATPMCSIGASPTSPLRIGSDVGAAILLAAEISMPIRILPTPMLGGTAPVTFAGALALQNAEMLSGLTIAQVVNPGCPVVLTPRLTSINMRTGTCSVIIPEVARASACATQLAHSYDLPVDAFALAGGWPALDEQMGCEKAINAVLAALAGVNWFTGFGSIDAGTCSSVEQLVIDNEIVSMVDHALAPVEVNEETLALDLIDRVGPGGSFIGEVHTLRHLRTGGRYASRLTGQAREGPPLFEGRRDMVTIARERVREILRTHQVPQLDDHVSRELDRILEEARKEYAALPE